MNEDYNKNRNIVYSLEWVKSEMELKMHQYAMANKEADLSEPKRKIKCIADAQDYICEVYEVIERLKKEIDLKDLTNKKLHAEINILKKD